MWRNVRKPHIKPVKSLFRIVPIHLGSGTLISNSLPDSTQSDDPDSTDSAYGTLALGVAGIVHRLLMRGEG